MQADLICLNCINFNKVDFNCNAFKEIPNEILSGKNDHSEPLKGQGNKIIFEKRID